MLSTIITVFVVVFLIANLVIYIIDWRRSNKEYEFMNQNAEEQLYSKPINSKKYAGKWFEVALLPNFFESNCVGAIADYKLIGYGFDVVNTCLQSDGSQNSVSGVATPFEAANQFKDRWAKVEFFGSALPNIYSRLFQGDYLILYVEESLDNANYQAAIVGSIDKNYLWILSRTPNLDQTKLENLIEIAKKKGYDVSKLQIHDLTVYNKL